MKADGLSMKDIFHRLGSGPFAMAKVASVRYATLAMTGKDTQSLIDEPLSLFS
jgi:hypothetical protein